MHLPAHPPFRHARRLGLSLSLLALAACATGPGAPPATATPPLSAQWSEAPAGTGDRPLTDADAARLARWWDAFGQPELTGLIELALRQHPDLRSAQASLHEAQALRAAAEAGARPSLGLSAGASRSRVDGGSDTRSLKLAFGASWEPDLWGAQGAAIDASRLDEQAAAATLQATRLALAAEVALAHVGWRDAQAREQIARDSLASLEDTQAMTRWNLQAGRASSLDLEQAVLATEQTRASLASVVAEGAQARHLLARLTGQTEEALARNVSASGPLPRADAALQRLAAGVPAEWLQRRPDLVAAEAAVRAAWLRREQTRRAGWPGLSLNGSLGLQAAGLSALGQPGAGLLSLAAALDAPLLDGGRRQALVGQKDAALERSAAAYDAAVLGAVQDVQDSLSALQAARSRAAALDLAAQAAHGSLLLQQLRRQAGLIDLATLLEAQRAELSARSAQASAQASLSQNLVRTWKALGGGWTATPDAAPSTNAPAAATPVGR